MARSATLLRFNIDISDVDANVYESVALRVAQHPSESDVYCICRVIAYCLHIGDGIDWSKAGLCDGDEPALKAESLTGEMKLWIDIGSPSADRLHKASKRVPRVVVYTHKRPELLLAKLSNQSIHRADELELYSLDPGMIDGLAQQLERTNNWSVFRQDNELLISVGAESFNSPIIQLRTA